MTSKTSTPKKNTKLPFFLTPVSAGFPSPATEEIASKLDLNEYLIKHPVATFFVRVKGSSMKNAGIFEDDLLIVDRSLTARAGDIILAVLEGEFTLKRFYKKGSKYYLKPENDAYKMIELTKDLDFQVWGVVTKVIKELI